MSAISFTTLAFLQKLKVNGVVNYSRRNAETLVIGLTSPHKTNNKFTKARRAEGAVLHHLDATSALPYRLQDVINEVHRKRREGIGL